MEIFENTSDKEFIQTHAASAQEAIAVDIEDEIRGNASEIAEDQAGVVPPQPQGWKFIPPTREQFLVGASFWGVILLGAVLRFWGLGDKPLHHDESLHAYFSLQLMHNIENWASCLNPLSGCYHYDPLLHGPFQFHIIAFVYKISQLLGVYDHGVNTFTVRIPAATLGTVIVGLPYFFRDRLGNLGAWLACFLLAVSPSMVYFSRFAREDIYMACFTLLLAVGVARYLRSRKMLWLVIAALGFALSYATKEATFLTIAVFGSFFGGLLVWELGVRWLLRSNVDTQAALSRYLPKTGAPVAVFGYLLVLGVVAKVFFAWLKGLSIYITDPSHVNAANAYVQGLKDRTVPVVFWISILLCVYVVMVLLRELSGKESQPGQQYILGKIDPEKQPLLSTIVSMPWIHWFAALVCSSFVFVLLFTVLFTNFRTGIGDGIWQGLYYWLQQQQVARGGQPWYYYLLLIPFYEQIGVIFGIVGVIRCLVQPTRFRLFLVYWLLGNVFIYSWAGEKMPWLMIHMTMPMMLVAAIGLEPAIAAVINLVKGWIVRPDARLAVSSSEVNPLLVPVLRPRPKIGLLAGSSAIFGTIMAVLLLLPTLHNMYEVTYIHPADAPHEMMIYVQTTTDINIVMGKIDTLDQKLYGGQHKLSIGVMNDATWPFAWYLRDYTNVCFNFPSGCPNFVNNAQAVIAGGDNLPSVYSEYNKSFAFHQYHMRTQWDQGYMMPPCIPSKTNPCTDPQPYTGVGPLLWLSYGDNPPPNAQFNLSLAAKNVWQWWWDRKALGSTDGTYDMGLLIRNGLGVKP